MEEIRVSGSGIGVVITIEGKLIRSIDLRDGGVSETPPGFHPEIYRQFKDYLDGKPVRFDLPLDRERLTQFQVRTFAELAKVPAGTTVSYGELAGRVATERHSRAVARALAANPFPIVIPCHRVVAKDGGLGGFSCGLPVKIKLLEIEKSFRP
jgi:methylated-DNA-[protein]-cysteine S-methyltransferase